MIDFQSVAVASVRGERDRQDRKWGSQRGHSDLRWYTILGEETGEVARAILEGDPDAHLREELVQCAAVCVAWIEAIDSGRHNTTEASA